MSGKAALIRELSEARVVHAGILRHLTQTEALFRVGHTAGA